MDLTGLAPVSLGGNTNMLLYALQATKRNPFTRVLIMPPSGRSAYNHIGIYAIIIADWIKMSIGVFWAKIS